MSSKEGQKNYLSAAAWTALHYTIHGVIINNN